MPSKSKAQQQAMGIAYAAKTGKIPASKLKGASKNMAKMGADDLEDFAKTKHKGLPKRKKKFVAESINEFISYPRLRDTYRNDDFDIMENPEDFASDVFFNEYLPTKGFMGHYEFSGAKDLEKALDDITANFSTYMEQNYHEEWDPRHDRTLYRKIVQEFLKDPRMNRPS